jgi:uncharacterized protein involved in exopolysaccharide biosynthesis
MNELGSSPVDRLSVIGQGTPQGFSAGPAQAQESEVSIRDFLSILRRRKAIALQTFVIVVAVGTVVTFLTRPQYRSTVRILVEGKAAAVSLNNTTDPLGQLFLPAAGHEVNTQVEVLRSPILLSKVCKEVRATERDIRLDVRQVTQTDVIEISAISPLRDLAQKFASALPRVYLEDIKVSRLREVSGALDFARHRLRERNTRLVRSEKAMEAFKSRVGVINSQTESTNDINAASAARDKASQAEADAASAQARYNALKSARTNLPVSTNPQIEALKLQLANLRDDRKKLLFRYKEDQPQVRDVDQQITTLEQRLASTPKTVTTVSRVPNSLISNYDQAVAEARAAADSAQANLAEARSRATELRSGLNKYNPIERTQLQLQRDIDDDREAVAALSKSVEDLSIRQKAIE